MSEERWNSRVDGLLRNASGRMLVVTSGEGAALPHVELEGVADDELPSVREAFANLLGMQTIVVRPVARSPDEDCRTLDIAFELELLEPAPTLRPGLAWVEPGELANRPMSIRDRELVERLLGDRPPPKRAPWSRPGWFSEASAWIETSLAELGRSTTGPVEQLSTWCLSSILRVPTADGRVFFKATASLPLFGDEATVTRGLARLFPESVPQPLAIDAERRWMLLDDFGSAVGWTASVETRVEVLSLFGRMQVETADRTEELLELGAFDRRPDWLARGIASLLREPYALGLDEKELEQLVALAPSFVDACARLAAGAVPDTLVHGDLHFGNVAHRSGRYVIFDWTDASVAHPFMDLLSILFEDDAEARRTLRDAYLTVWSEHAARTDLLELWSLAEPLASLNQAISYRSIVENVEPGTGQELGSMLPYWLRKALAAPPES